MKLIKLFAQLTLLVAISASISQADVMPFQWSTTGTFSAPGLPSGLSFSGAGTSAVTNTASNGSLLGINLGHFTFGDITTDYSGTFTLTVNFFRPDGSTDPVYQITLLANANTSGRNDELIINFPSASRFGFGGTDGTGTFMFGVKNLDDYRNGSHIDDVILSGDITGAVFTGTQNGDPSAVPEPASVLLLCGVLGCLALVAKRKLA
jgi:hypothetical protein